MSSPRGYAWCFTLNNPDMTPEALGATMAPVSSYYLFQEERGDSGTPHFQGYIEFPNNKTLPFVRKLIPRAHWERRRGSQQQACDYCRKEEGRVSGPFEHGAAREVAQGKRSDLLEAIEAHREGGIKRVREDHPEVFIKYSRGFRELDLANVRQSGTAPEVILLFGPGGCGKTRTFYDAEGDDGCHLLCSAGFWFDGYERHDAVLLDDFDGSRSRWTLAQCLLVLDRYRIRVPIKGSFVVWCPKRIYVTTNVHPLEWYDFSNRQQQIRSLVRRFTSLHWWKTEDSEQPDIYQRGDVDFERFFRGRDGAQRELDAASGRLIARAPHDVDYFNF